MSTVAVNPWEHLCPEPKGCRLWVILAVLAMVGPWLSALGTRRCQGSNCRGSIAESMRLACLYPSALGPSPRRPQMEPSEGVSPRQCAGCPGAVPCGPQPPGEGVSARASRASTGGWGLTQRPSIIPWSPSYVIGPHQLCPCLDPCAVPGQVVSSLPALSSRFGVWSGCRAQRLLLTPSGTRLGSCSHVGSLNSRTVSLGSSDTVPLWGRVWATPGHAQG